MSATWLQALRAYVSRKGPPATLVSRYRLYDQVAQAHLPMHRGERLRADNLAVLREARWALLRDGTIREKADLLEHVLKSLSQASETVTYEGSTAPHRHQGKSNRADRRRGGDSCDRRGCNVSSTSRHQSVHNAQQDISPSTTTAAASSSSSPLQNLSERHQLLLEQMQCFVEAKVAEIPLTARHYRYPLRSPLLAEVSPELPLLLVDELAHQPRVDAQSQKQNAADASTPDWEAQVDCAASLAGAGHTREALAICGEDGRMFRAVLQQVARQRRDGWRRAWALAEAVPTEQVIGVAASSRYSEDWLRGVLETVRLRFRAAPPHRAQHRSDEGNDHDDNDNGASREDDSEQLFLWVDQLRELIMSSNVTTEAGQVAASQKRALCKAQRLVMDTYLSVCPPSHWREAVGVVLELKAASRRSYSATENDVAEQNLESNTTDTKPESIDGAYTSPVKRDDGDSDSNGGAVSAGRLLALLQFAQQPWMTLLFFYGNPLEMLVASAAKKQQQHSACQKSRAWPVNSKEVQLVVEELVCQAKEAGRLPVAAGALLHERDVHHAAVYNHAMAALAAAGHTEEAMLFYDTMPVTYMNAYTHWVVLQIFLQPNSSLTVVPALGSSANYEHCHRALKRLVRILSTPCTTKTAWPSSPSRMEAEENERSFTREQANVWESMALWAALRRDADTALLCATHAPGSCRYVHLIAIIAAANDNNFHSVSTVLRQLCRSPHTTRKELCLAAAAAAIYYPLVPNGSGDAHQPTPAIAAELASVYDDLTRALGRSIGHQQTSMDEVMQQLIDYGVSLQRRRGVPVDSEDVEIALQGVLVKEKILNSTMDLVRLGCPESATPAKRQNDNDADDDNAAAVWRTIARLIQSIGSQQGLSVARAAPALVSAGVSAEVAIDFFPL